MVTKRRRSNDSPAPVPIRTSPAIDPGENADRAAANEAAGVKSTQGGGGGSSGGGTNRVPFKTSPAIRSDINAEREAANRGTVVSFQQTPSRSLGPRLEQSTPGVPSAADQIIARGLGVGGPVLPPSIQRTQQPLGPTRERARARSLAEADRIIAAGLGISEGSPTLVPEVQRTSRTGPTRERARAQAQARADEVIARGMGIREGRPTLQTPPTPERSFIRFENGTLAIGSGNQLGFLNTLFPAPPEASRTELALLAIPLIGPAESRAARAGARALSAARTAAESRLGRFLADIGITTAKGIAITEGAKAVGRLTAPQEQRGFLSDPGFREVMGVGLEAEREALAGESFWKGVAFELSPFFSGRKDVFEETVRQQFATQGLTGNDLDTAVLAAQRQRTFLSVGEAAALLEVSRSAEKIGRRNIVRSFGKAAAEGLTIPKKQAGVEIFKRTFGPIASAGVVEGFSGELAQQFAREQNLDLRTAALMGGLGGLTAGVIGGTIASTRMNRPGLSKVIEYGTYITDPFEKPGDIAQDIVEAIERRVTGRPTPRPVILETFKPGDVIVPGITPSKTKKAPGQGEPNIIDPVKRRLRQMGTPSGMTVNNNLFVFSVTPPAQTTQPSRPSAPTISPGVPVLTNPLTNVFTPEPAFPTNPLADIFTPPSGVPTPTPVPVPVGTPVNVPTEIPIPAEVPLPVLSDVPLNVPINIPGFTPQLRVPPPLPFEFPAGGDGGGTAKRAKKAYVDEVEEGFKLLRSFLGGGSRGRRRR